MKKKKKNSESSCVIAGRADREHVGEVQAVTACHSDDHRRHY